MSPNLTRYVKYKDHLPLPSQADIYLSLLRRSRPCGFPWAMERLQRMLAAGGGGGGPPPGADIPLVDSSEQACPSPFRLPLPSPVPSPPAWDRPPRRRRPDPEVEGLAFLRGMEGRAGGARFARTRLFGFRPVIRAPSAGAGSIDRFLPPSSLDPLPSAGVRR